MEDLYKLSNIVVAIVILVRGVVDPDLEVLVQQFADVLQVSGHFF
jgi:hypothetical protein